MRARTPISTTSSSKTWEKNQIYKKWLYQNPKDILIKASNGASDFGNKFGQPLISGSILTFEHNENKNLIPTEFLFSTTFIIF